MHKTTLLVAGCIALAPILWGQSDEVAKLDVARFDATGRLHIPIDMDEWVFIGSSLGMGYSQENFDPDSPGMFQVARMEPQAYAAFKNTGKFADGTMIALHFYGSENEISNNRAGYVMGDLHFAEIHYKDSERFPDGFNFYNLNNGDLLASEVELPNDCVDCHKRDGAYEGVFVQFYAPIQRYLPDSIRKALEAAPEHGGH
jgi:hypothetical protein